MGHLKGVFREAEVSQDLVDEWMIEAEESFECRVKPKFPDDSKDYSLKVSGGRVNVKAAGVKRGRKLLSR